MIWGVPNSTNDIEDNSKVFIYPNPAKDYVQINNPDYNSVTFYSTLGNIVLQTNDSFKSLDNLSPGLYIIIIKDSFGKLMGTQKLIVR